MNAVRHDHKRAADLRLVDDIERDAEENWLVDQDEAAMIASQLDRLEAQLLFLARRLERFRTALARAAREGDREPALAGA